MSCPQLCGASRDEGRSGMHCQFNHHAGLTRGPNAIATHECLREFNE